MTRRGFALLSALITALLCVVSILAVLTGRETYRVPTADLGKPAKQAVNA